MRGSVDAFMAAWKAMSRPDRHPARRVRGLGIAILSYTKSTGTASLCYISAYPTGQGRGTRLLQAITDLADAHGITLEVVPSSASFLAGPTGDRLVNWYRRHGFTGRTADGLAYVREPIPASQPTE